MVEVLLFLIFRWLEWAVTKLTGRKLEYKMGVFVLLPPKTAIQYVVLNREWRCKPIRAVHKVINTKCVQNVRQYFSVIVCAFAFFVALWAGFARDGLGFWQAFCAHGG